MTVVDWSELPPEILDWISQKLTLYGDYLRFRSVCHSWRSSVPETPLHLPPQLPWLLLSLRSFFDFSTHKTHLLNLPQSSPHTRICGSSQGWLVILDGTPEIRLLNPVTRKSVALPPLHTFPDVVSFSYSNVGREYAVRNCHGSVVFHSLRTMCSNFVKKIVLSSSPLDNRDEFVAVAIIGYHNLAFCRNGYSSWVSMDPQLESCRWEDVVYKDGSFYAVSQIGTLAVCNFRDFVYPLPLVSIFNAQGSVLSDIQYAVFSGEEMLLVTRFLEPDFSDAGDESNFVFKTVGFEVFKMDWDVKIWDRVETLGDRVLFVGGNSSLSFIASEFNGCSGDCIYFTDDYSESNHEDAYGKHDLGIFRLQDKSVEPLPCFPPNSNLQIEWPLPVWVSPNPL